MWCKQGPKCACTVWLGSCFQWFSALRRVCPRELLPLQPVSRTNVYVADWHSGTTPSQLTTGDRAVQISAAYISWICYLGNLWEWINACCKQLSFGVVCCIALLCQQLNNKISFIFFNPLIIPPLSNCALLILEYKKRSQYLTIYLFMLIPLLNKDPGQACTFSFLEACLSLVLPVCRAADNEWLVMRSLFRKY